MVTAPFFETWSRVHQVGAGQRLDLLAHPLEPAGVDDPFAHVGQCPLLLRLGGGRLPISLNTEILRVRLTRSCCPGITVAKA
ncbi:MAG TPA: hypothetical protein VFI46_01925, partial [Jiangellaceae bacterium]|nr:hypothetical protein [Jiangellaceae bacterium]